MAGWLHGVFVGEWLFVFPLCAFSLSLFCNYFLNAWSFDDACASADCDAFLTGTSNLRDKIRRVLAVARKLAS